MSNDINKIVVTMRRTLKVCTKEVFSNIAIPLTYEIVKMEKSGVYGIVRKEDGQLLITFKKVEEFYGERYLLTLEDNRHAIIKFYNELHISCSFHKIIKLLSISNNLYALVTEKNGERFLIRCNAIDFCKCAFPTDSSFTLGKEAVKDTTVILTKDLKTYDILEKDVVVSTISNDAMCAVIYDVNKQKRFLLRFSDMKLSHPLDAILPIKIMDNAKHENRYVEVQPDDMTETVAMMRIEDFVSSPYFTYGSLFKISDNYAIAKKNGNDVVIRLADFSIAEFN